MSESLVAENGAEPAVTVVAAASSGAAWQSDLFGCMSDLGECLVCLCMPSLTTYNIATAIGTDKLLAFLYGVLILVPGINEFVLMILYKETAAVYGIEIDQFLGVLLSYFCTPCLLMQLNNHIKVAGKPAGALPRV